MKTEEILKSGAFSLPSGEKQKLFSDGMTELTRHHRKACPEYGRLLQALGCPEEQSYSEETVPFLPVSLFKEMNLCSVPKEEVFKILTSSGTTGQKVSKIYLDAETSANQQKALAHIVSDFLGPNRIPALMLDTRQVLKDRTMFSARGAGIMGFSVFSSRICFALDKNMKLDLDGIRKFLEEHRGEPVLLFGFTYIIWKHVIRVLEEMGEHWEIPNGILIHGGGWKKLNTEAVTPEEFKARTAAVTGITRISDYYGMAEQTGCIYMECPCGHLHASVWSDVLIRRERDYSICGPGEEGVIQVLSLLPRSYPGHSILTEDKGILLGEDDCPCGRLGKYFRVTGRVPKAEVRGCSDTYEG